MQKTFNEIPAQRPSTPLLDKVLFPEQLRRINELELNTLIDELRQYLLYSVGKTGGHFGAGLGVVELTTALHYVFNTPEDKIIWDVGHQAYPHKILTGRREKMCSLRQKMGISAFPRRAESIYDAFGVGHSSTSISAALGMALAAKLQDKSYKSIAVIGDGALTAGMAFEALNHASDLRANMLVILNDNDMSISRNVGGLSNYLAKILSSPTYAHMRMLVSGTLFEELGWNYIGPIDGHDISTLVSTLRNMRDLEGPQFLHIITKKGKGFLPAEKEPTRYHAITKLEPVISNEENNLRTKKVTYSNIFSRWLCDTATQDTRLVGITPAMKEGSDLVAFSEQFPDRYIDTAIAEQHAATLAAGLACEGMKPVVAIYSTFLQRAYDQLIHDIAIQNLDVLFAIDRSGLVGEDGPTHAGSFDLSYLRCIPNMIIMTPSNERELFNMLTTGYLFKGPAAVRYPRGICSNTLSDNNPLQTLEIGKAIARKTGEQVAILVFGTLINEAAIVAAKFNYSLIDMRFVKPIDHEMLCQVAASHQLLVTLEENSIMGGAGSAVSEFYATQNITKSILHLGLPDYYVEHAKPSQMIAECHLDATGIEQKINERLALLNKAS
ncbi:UNVERIFIED_CONTAM: hypothetical protein GTU68_041411 [Idotea baltica]|nr:hypothetical protein [Idotea baltica]